MLAMEPAHERVKAYHGLGLRSYGVNHTTAPIEVREHLRRIHAGRSTGSPYLADALLRADVKEFALLATCNRVEIYTVGGEADLPDLVASIHNVSNRKNAVPFYQHEDLEAVRHLARVACGLDSMVLGESQIQGQVAESFASAVSQERIGPVLTEVFQTAIRCGKRARTETCIGCNPSSVSAAAVHIAQEALGDLSNRRFLLLGAGEMGGLALKAFSYRGVTEIDVVSRTFSSARKTASPWNATPHGIDALESLLVEVDAVLTATTADTPVISRSMLEDAMRRREGRELLIIDIAVPRDVAPDARSVPGIRLLDIDALEDTVNAGLTERRGEIPQVEVIIDEEVARFSRRVRERIVRPVIADLRRKAEMVRREEMARLRASHEQLEEDTWKDLDRFTRRIVHRLFSSPMNRLRSFDTKHSVDDEIQTLRRLFSLDEPSR